MDVKVLNLGKDKFIKFGDFLSHFQDEEATLQMIREIFTDGIYQFQTTNPKPLIIDLGAEEGVSTLFLKQSYPQAKIVCFETNANACALLEKNIKANKISDVTLVQADPIVNPAKLSSYIHHEIDFLKFDVKDNEEALLLGLGKKLTNIKEMVGKLYSKDGVEKLKKLLQPHFKVEVTEKTNPLFYIVRAKRV